MTLPRPKNTITAQPTVKRLEDTKFVENYDPAKSTTAKKKRPYGQPIKNMLIEFTAEDKAIIEELQNKTGTCHIVFQKMIDGEPWFIKLTTPGSPNGPNEAAIGEISKFYLDELSAESAAIYTVKKDGFPEYIGKASKALPNFKSLLKDPIRDEELRISVLDKGPLTVKQLDEIDEEFASKGIKLEALDKKVKIYNLFYPIDLIHYRKIKKLSMVITYLQFSAEGDAHKNNVGPGNFDDGRKADEETFKYEEAEKFLQKLVDPIDRIFRNPEGKYIIHGDDLDESPDIKHDKRIVWITRPAPPYGKVIGKVRDYLDVNNKYYNEEEIARHKSLKNHPVYLFHKNKMHLRFLITNPEIFGPLLSLQLKKDFSKEINGKLCCPHQEFDELFQKRQAGYKRELRFSKQFKDYLEKDGAYAMKIIEEKYDEYNKVLIPLIEECKNDEEPGYKEDLLVSKDQLRTNYINLVLDRRGPVTQDTLLAALSKGNKHVIKTALDVMLSTDTAISSENLKKVKKFQLRQSDLDKVAALRISSSTKILNSVGLLRAPTPSSAPCNQNKPEPKATGLSL